MRQAAHNLRVSTRGQGLVDITAGIADWLAAQHPQMGLLTVFCRHTSASLTIQENADPSVQRDLVRAFARLAPENAGYEHDTEGPDDMPAHIKAALTQTSLSIPVAGGRMTLGTWQGVYLFEHRRAPHVREIALHYIGA
ncbi:MAG TPA: secondary thiamine-phosphate synthase enzyme YjbQ [Rhodoblastus sp.]|nr:secondary thiamine-phosphate synthase enzyme YjbQ [Rhodoblastus sp.]